MEQLLAKKLHEFIGRNNPELLLQSDQDIRELIHSKIQHVMPLLENLLVQNCPAYIIEELCMDQMTEDLKPSMYHYITSLLEEEFPERYEQLKEEGILTYEVANIITRCKKVFEQFHFSVFTEESRPLYQAVTGIAAKYFQEPINTGDHVL